LFTSFCLASASLVTLFKSLPGHKQSSNPRYVDELLDSGRHFLDCHPVLDLFQPGLFPLLNGASHAQGAMFSADGMVDVEMAEAFNEIVVCQGFV